MRTGILNISNSSISIIQSRMDLTEFSVKILVDYLYSGEIDIPSDINLLLDVAIAAQCFQLQVLV